MKTVGQHMSDAEIGRLENLRRIDELLQQLAREADGQGLQLVSYLLTWAQMDVKDRLRLEACRNTTAKLRLVDET